LIIYNQEVMKKKTVMLVVLIVCGIFLSFKVKRKKEILQFTFYRIPKSQLHTTGVHRITCERFSTRNELVSKITDRKEISRINNIILNARPMDEADFDTKVKAFIAYKNSNEIDSFCISRFGIFSFKGKYWQSYDLINYIYRNDKN
jgi:hypothetical protein